MGGDFNDFGDMGSIWVSTFCAVADFRWCPRMDYSPCRHTAAAANIQFHTAVTSRTAAGRTADMMTGLRRSLTRSFASGRTSTIASTPSFGCWSGRLGTRQRTRV